MERLGRYEILEELGRGAMGVVYKADDPDLDRLVALKVMLPPPGLDATALQQRRARFQREGRAAARLTHPNIVTVYDVGEDQGQAFLVMELLEGQSLDQLLRMRRALPLDQVVTVGEQVAHALDYAHRQGVVHRDVKPANILLTPEGVVKVTDFGIARITGETFTQLGQAVGTPSYMSPEQVAGLKVDGRSDLFSLGAVLYELITGDKAFPGDTISTITYRIIHEDPTPLRRLNPAYPAALDACLKKALAKDPARRYARTTDLARDLRAAVEGAATPVDAPGEVTVADTARTEVHPPRRPRRSRWIWITAGAVAVAGLALALTVWLRPFEEPPAPPRAPIAPPVALPATRPDDQAAKAKAAAEEEARRKAADEEAARQRALQEEASRHLVEARTADEKKRQEEAAARKQAELAESSLPPTGTLQEIRDGKLVSIHRKAGTPGIYGNYLLFAKPEAIRNFQDDVRLNAYTAPPGGDARMRLRGSYYNDGTSGPGYTGDVRAEIYLRGTSSGVDVNYGVYRCVNATCSTATNLTPHTTVKSTALGRIHTLGIGWDGAVLTLTVDGVPTVVDPRPIVPVAKPVPNISEKTLSAQLRIGLADGTGLVAGDFDNVRVNGVLYDDFRGPRLDPTKWRP